MDNNQKAAPDTNNANETASEKEQPLILHNPLNENDDKKFTQEDIDREQQYKEALTERD